MKKSFRMHNIVGNTLCFTLFLLCSSMSLSDLNTHLQQDLMAQKVTLNTHSRMMRKVLMDIEKQTNVKFVYSNATIKPEDRVTIAFTGEKLSTVLNKLFEPLNISYSILGSRILLKKNDNRTGYVGDATKPYLNIQ